MTRAKWSVIMHASKPALSGDVTQEMKSKLAQAVHMAVSAIKQDRTASDAAQAALDHMIPARTNNSWSATCLVHDRAGVTAGKTYGAVDVFHYDDGTFLAFVGGSLSQPDNRTISLDLPPNATVAVLQESLARCVTVHKAAGIACGLLALDGQGRPAWAHNTPDFCVAYQSNNMHKPAVYARAAEKKTRRRSVKSGFGQAAIDISNPFDAWGWSRKLKVTPQQLRDIVEHVGTNAESVATEARRRNK